MTDMIANSASAFGRSEFGRSEFGRGEAPSSRGVTGDRGGGGNGGGGGGPPAARSLELARAAMHATLLATGGGTPAATQAAAAERSFRGAAVDSRRVAAGNLFFALPGERVDGFDYCAAAQAAGAAAVVVAAARGLPAGVTIPVLAVEDPRAALGQLARAVRREFSGRVVGITGSNGKTTTKELCAAALGAAGIVLRTAGNLNTEVGLPLTILSATGHEAFWVLEMAMRGRGQIAALADIACPDVGVITNVAGAHLELLGSLEEVARAKGELFAKLGHRGIAVLPGGDPLIEAQAAHLPAARQIRFEATPTADRSSRRAPTVADVLILETWAEGAAGQVIRFSVNRCPVVTRLPLVGRHNAENAAAALAVALALGVPAPAAARALATTILPPHRSSLHAVAGRVVIDDCYNANPASMRAALATLVASTTVASTATSAESGPDPGVARDQVTAPRAFAVLGDMLELGPESAALHHAVGFEFGRRLAGLAVVGPLAENIAAGAVAAGMDAARIVVVANDAATAANTLGAWTRPGDWILVKASRGMRLERAVDALTGAWR